MKTKYFLCLSLILGACGGDSGPVLETPQACNPMGGTRCITPFPSNLYTVEDLSTDTGVRLELPEGALPVSQDGYPIASSILNGRDGFSAAAHIFTAFPGGVDPSNLVPHTAYGDSLTDASPTVLIDMDHGGRVAHFAELDLPSADDPDHQALYIRPSERLRGGTRYAVAIRKSLKARGGGELPMPEGFAAVLDERETDHALLEAARPRYAEIFAALEAEGISRDDLVVAWDFTTASDASTMRDLLESRDTAMPVMGAAGANLTFEVVDDVLHDDPAIRRRIDGTFEAPLFLTQAGAYAPGTTLSRDAAGRPQMAGMYDIPFTAIIPECAYTQGPVPVLIYGHGLMGASDQVASGSIRKTADALCMVVVGTDWRGMSSQDLPQVFLTLNNLNNADMIFGVLVQGVVNFIATEQVSRGPMAQQLFLDDEGGALVDPTRVYYYGLSQGGIFGGTFLAFDPFVERGVLGVGGANYSMMLERSQDWPVYKTTLIGAYPNALDVVIAIHLMQMFWDASEPNLASAHMGAIPGAPPKQVLMQIGMGDAEVSNISSHYQARTMDIPLLGPTADSPWGLEVQDGVLDNALVIFDGGDRAPVGNIPPDDNDAHYVTREQPAAWRQMARFFETGEIVQTCTDGTDPAPCDCTQGYCD